MTDFLRIIETGSFTLNDAYRNIEIVRRKVSKKCAQLQRVNPNAGQSYEQLKADLTRLGVTPDTTYLYIQGHHLFDKVVLPMLNKVCEKLIRQRQAEIERQSQHGTQRRNELSCYTNSVADTTAMLKKNLGFFLSAPYQRIKADLTKFMQGLEASQHSPSTP